MTKRRQIRLNNTGNILREMARVYRCWDAEELDGQDAARRISSLAIMRQTREFQLVEENMVRMQEKLDQLQSNRAAPMLKVLK
jgi:hypothetical protein